MVLQTSMRQQALFAFIISCWATVIQFTECDKYSFEAFTCRLLRAKYIESQAWIEYPIVYEPIVKGRLTIWAGISTLPGGEFECLPAVNNGTSQVTLNYASLANKFEWTFYDMSKGVTHHGITVNSRENAKYEVAIATRQSQSYLECNLVKDISLIGSEVDKLKTVCRGCSQPIVALIDSLIREMIKSRFDEEIMENLGWHLTQVIASQHFSAPLPL